jgi:branched-chain amino acid transport system substrate-binding protein
VVDRCVPVPKVRPDSIGTTTRINKEVDELKRIVFLIIGALLVLGLVLPGCGTTPPPEEEVIYTFEDGTIVIGLAGEVGHVTGDMAYAGAAVAAAMINGAGGVVIDGVAHNFTIQKVDTKEAQDESGEQGELAMTAAIDNLDFVMGGFRTEAVAVYREVVMNAEKIFFNCGAATESLQYSTVSNYDKYQYWFKTTPYNEYFLAESVLRLIDFSATQIRAALNLTEDATLRACIVAENLKWARDEQVPELVAGLPALHIQLQGTPYLVGATEDKAAETQAAIADIFNQGYNPHIIIPVYSGICGAYFAGTLKYYVGLGALGSLAVGINVYEQFKSPWAAGGKLTEAPPGGPNCAYDLLLDTWGDGVSQTTKTATFLAAVGAALGGEYPLYTAATYDALFLLKDVLENVGYAEAGVGKAKADDIIGRLENPAYAIETSTGVNCVYPQPGTQVGGKPALTEAQVETIYDVDDYGYTYDVNDWVMPPHTTHDLAYGPGGVDGNVRATGIGCQWQWDAGASVWKKKGVWPASGYGEVDQYGDWDFEYTGTVPLVIPAYLVGHSW